MKVGHGTSEGAFKTKDCEQSLLGNVGAWILHAGSAQELDCFWSKTRVLGSLGLLTFDPDCMAGLGCYVLADPGQQILHLGGVVVQALHQVFLGEGGRNAVYSTPLEHVQASEPKLRP